MVVSTTPLKLISKEKKMEKRQDEGEKRRLTLKERQEKIYPFPDSDLPDMLDQLLEKQLIRLPECKQPAEMGRVNDPNYCKYHRVISHPVEKCFVLKELILKLALDEKIELELDDMAQTNHVAVIIQSDSRLSAIGSLIQFGSLEPVVIYSSPEDLQNNDFRADGPKEEEKQVDNVEEGWTLVMRRKKRKQSFSQKESGSCRTYRSKGKSQRRNTRKNLRKFLPIIEESEGLSRPRRPIILKDFFPKNFPMEIVSCHTTSITEEDAFPSNAMEETPKPEDLLPLGINDLLTLSREVKDTIIEILKNDDVSTIVSSPTEVYDSCCMSISFSDEDLLLGSKLHNRPLYVLGYVREQKLNQILIDNGSVVNILPKSTMNQLGTIRLEIVIGDLQASTIFHVIDSRTTYKMPFTKAEPHLADAKFYTKSEDVSEIISTEVPVTKGTFKNEQEMITSKKSNKGDAPNGQQNGESTTETKLKAREAEKIATLQKEVSNPSVLRYIPLSRRKNGESAFAECSKNLTVKNTEILKENFAAPLTKIEKGEAKKIEKKDLEAYLPERRTVEGFDLKTYKLMAKAGYDFTTRIELKSVKIFDERPELSPTQKKLQKQGYSIPNSRAGIGYQSSKPVRITGKGKAKVANTCHITVEESKDSEEGKKDRSQRSSVFDRIVFSAIRPSVFQRVSTSIAKDNNQVSTCSSTRLSAFQRLNTNAKKVQSISPTPTTRKYAFKRLSVLVTRDQKKASMSVSNKSSLVTGDEEIRSAFPSRMKRKMFVSVNTEGSLKVKRHDVVFTRLEDNEPEDEVDMAGCCHVTIEKTSDHDIFEEDAEAAPLSLEDGGQSTIDELKEVNLGTKEEPRPTFISTQLSDNDENEYVNLIKAYKDVFAWSYKEMPGLDPKEEVNKLIEAGFIREVKYPTWIANIVPVRKKNGQLRVYVDFCDLNNACPKDDFPLPIIEIMIDATAGHEALSFMDGSLGYNQIRMALDDEEKTTFRTSKVKSKKKCDHLKDLKLVLDRLRKYQLRMNPLKCAFGVTSGKFLGFIGRHRDIEVDHSKIDAIQKMPSPKNLHELRRLQGRLAYIRRFISNLVGRCQPFQRLMRKDAVFGWDQLCQNAFDSIKKYLFNPLVLSAPAAGKQLILYIAAQETSLGALLAQENDKGKECALYYLSRTLTGAELNYSSIEKMCLALFFVVDKLRHYMQAFTIHLVAKADPVKYILSRPVISGRLAKWAIILQQYDIVYIPQKAVKGQALAGFLADHPVPSNWKLCDNLPDEEVLFVESMEPWIMFFDGAARRSGAGVGIVFIFPEKHMLPYSFTLDYLEHGKLPTDPRHRAEIRRRAARFIYYKDTLYRRSYEGLLLRCLGKEESTKALEEAHSGICGVHQSGPKLQYHLKRMGYYWPTMIHDSMHFAKYCDACQFHANFIHQPPEPLHPTIASWPFEAWGLDLVGPITPKSSAGHSYILAGTDYFSKWAEVVPLREAKKENIVNFVQTHIIYRYGIPHHIVTDNGRQFANTLMDKLCEKFNSKQYKSSMYNAAANGLAEAFNKTLCSLLKKVVSKTKRDWQEKIGEALWAYRTTHRTPTGVTPYSLVYGVEAVLPLEREIPSLRMAIQEGLTTEDNARLRLQELEALDEKRLEAQQALECYQARM
ncbi:ty3-gypsy retrotransposon protein [Cucumis melo var. makuwa]|uniref:Ty3-gypsy retrotransposon protein n=1 Tax=Cucumis melo var. makuwa TaxID=1194695 RepID=A0A5A7SUA1_CUCMM|nr:ty3-gypsy retrotransposon protein [Cucumis melo var. makuwa]